MKRTLAEWKRVSVYVHETGTGADPLRGGDDQRDKKGSVNVEKNADGRGYIGVYVPASVGEMSIGLEERAASDGRRCLHGSRSSVQIDELEGSGTGHDRLV